MQNPNNLAWLDMEMTGLNPDSDKIIEVAMIITDQDLNILAQSDVLVIHQPDSIMDNMDAWNTSTHQRTGLTAKVKAATLTEAEAEQQLLHFMARYMPKLEAYFHYRNLDVSTLKELAKRWHPAVAKGVVKKGAHQALDDIIESIEEMKHYRAQFLKLPQ